MGRRLLDADRQREQRRQELMTNRMLRPNANRLRGVLTIANNEMIAHFHETGEVRASPSLVTNLTAAYKLTATQAASAFGKRIFDQGKSLDLSMEIKEEDFADWMARQALAYVTNEVMKKRIKSVADASKQQLVDIIARGLTGGLTNSEIVANLTEALPTLTRFRAEMIARTEIHAAANYGALEAAKGTGLDLEKEWVANADPERTRQTHREADGQTVGTEEKFVVGNDRLDYPGDPAGSAKEVINCRCAVSYLVRSE